MKVVVAGSRSITDYQLVRYVILQSGFEIDERVSGGARGGDRFGERFAKESGIKIKQLIPDWSIGRRAGLIRNEEMAKYADALIAVWDGKSTGTQHMITMAKKYN